MKFHNAILIITFANLILCPSFFYILNNLQSEDTGAVAINTGLGWIFWLGMFCIAAPAFLSDDTRKNLFSSQYIGGTVLLAIVNVAIPLVVAFTMGS